MVAVTCRPLSGTQKSGKGCSCALPILTMMLRTRVRSSIAVRPVAIQSKDDRHPALRHRPAGDDVCADQCTRGRGQATRHRTAIQRRSRDERCQAPATLPLMRQGALQQTRCCARASPTGVLWSPADTRYPRTEPSPLRNLAKRGIKAEGRRASSCRRHASGMTPPPGTAIWLPQAQRFDLLRIWPA